MDDIKIVGVLLICSLVSTACSTEDLQNKQKTQPRIDSYGDILRPPPPPPNLRFSHANQRYQRQNNQFRQPHVMRQPFYIPPSQERYPLAPWKEPEQPSMLQKVSSWLFATGSDNVPATYAPPSHPNQEQPPSFGPPIRLQQQNQQKKICNMCNHFPWIPVIRYQSPPIKNSGEPSKLLQPPQDHIYLPPKNTGEQNHLSDVPSTGSGNSFNYNIKPTITNSYGNPIPSNTYDTPLPVTNDGGELPVLPPHRKPHNPEFDVVEFGNQDGRYSNKDTIENLESNNVPLLSKPNHNTRGQGSSFKSTNSGHQSRPAINNVYDHGRGVHVLQPIPFPNLSSVPLPPIFNARPFKTINKNQITNTKIHYDSVSSSTQHPINYNTYNSQNSPSTQNYQLLPSVSLAEFTSSIDYPISIIQSPLVEIDASKGNSNGHQPHSDSNNINLNKNPIIVHNDSFAFDSYSAASGGNDLNTNQESINFVTRDTIKSERPFLPTPVPIETNSKIHSLTPISYSFIDQTFSSVDKPVTVPTSTPPNHYTGHNSNFIEHTNTFKPYPTDTLQSIDSPFLYLKPSVPHKESEVFKKSTTAKPVTQTSPVTSGILNTGFRYLENNVVEGKWPPPNESFNEKPNDVTSKPKRIQIIIPYTTKNQPSPFKFSSNNIVSPSGWVPVIRDIDKNYGRKVPSSEKSSDINSVHDLQTTNALTDYHESSESKIVASSAPQHNITTFEYETSSFKPKKPKPTDLLEPIKNKTSFDEKKLQQNIDEWTSLEYSKVYKRQQKASTTTHLKRSKKIPDEYLTTTPVHKKPTQVFLSKINDLNGSLLDSESANSIRHTYETNLYNRTSVPKENYVYQKSTSKEPITIYYTTDGLRKTTIRIETTTTIPKTTTKPAWEKVQTSISPLTKEKIYVVTPQPWHVVNSTFSFVNNISESNTKANLLRESKNLSFKSPRFVVRPTPGPTGSQKESNDDRMNNGNNWKASFSWLQSINNLEEATTESRSSKSFFGLSTVTAYTPPDGSAVHTYSGHSRVTAVTPNSVSKFGK